MTEATNPKTTAASSGQVDQIVIRKDYMRRLIAGVRQQIKNDPDSIKASEAYGEDVTVSKWIDASILCSVIEDEILNNDGV